jgi:hypothetical protein
MSKFWREGVTTSERLQFICWVGTGAAIVAHALQQMRHARDEHLATMAALESGPVSVDGLLPPSMMRGTKIDSLADLLGPKSAEVYRQVWGDTPGPSMYTEYFIKHTAHDPADGVAIWGPWTAAQMTGRLNDDFANQLAETGEVDAITAAELPEGDVYINPTMEWETECRLSTRQGASK